MTGLQSSQGYAHIERCVGGPGIDLNVGASTSLYPGCKCQGQCPDGDSTSHCSCTMAYEEDGRLRAGYLSPNSPPIFECNANCTCGMGCVNRGSQCYSHLSMLSCFQTRGKNNGILTNECIGKGRYVGEYVGEILSSLQAKERAGGLVDNDSCYTVQYKEHMPDGRVLTTNIDATYKGNLTRFINHSCSPNLVMVPVRMDSIVPRLCLFAARDIEAKEEVCFSYFGKSGADVDPVSPDITFGKKQCLCGSKHCVGFLPLEIGSG